MVICNSCVRWTSSWDNILYVEEMEMKCNLCKWNLDERYIRYRDVSGYPYCKECYIQIGGII